MMVFGHMGVVERIDERPKPLSSIARDVRRYEQKSLTPSLKPTKIGVFETPTKLHQRNGEIPEKPPKDKLCLIIRSLDSRAYISICSVDEKVVKSMGPDFGIVSGKIGA